MWMQYIIVFSRDGQRDMYLEGEGTDNFWTAQPFHARVFNHYTDAAIHVSGQQRLREPLYGSVDVIYCGLGDRYVCNLHQQQIANEHEDRIAARHDEAGAES